MATLTRSQALNRKLKLGMIINICFTLFEFAVGLLTGSLALISDASHNLTDVLSIFISYIGNTLAQHKPTQNKTYGYRRVPIITAMFNGLMLLFLSFYLIYKAYQRFHNPEQVEGGIVMIIGFLGILVNGGVALLFIKDKDDLNIHSSLINMLFDALASAAALIAGLVIQLTGYTPIDALASGFTGLLLFISASNIIKRGLNILLQGVPEHLDINAVQHYLTSIPSVKDLHDLHIWALSSRDTILTCHLVVESTDLYHNMKLIKTIKQGLFDGFNIYHSTIELEPVQCHNSICTFYKI